SLKEALFPMDARVKPAHDGSRTGRKADKSACVAYFPVDSRNENLPEKCIHQNYASRPGWYAARDFCCAGAACLPLRREEGEPNRPLSVRLDATDGCRKPRPAPDPCFGVVLCNEYRNFNVSRSNVTRTRER